MFEILEHTADIGILARGATREEMFEEAESLLVNWLSEVLYYLDARRVVFGRFRVDRLTEREAAGQAWGEPRDARRHPPRVIVKGVTYHQLRIREFEGGFEARVFLDI